MKMNIFSKKLIIIIASLLIAVGAVGTTIAYIVEKTPPIENEFEKALVSCEVTETFNGVQKTDVAVQNTGNVTSYVRAVVVVTWVSTSDSSIYHAMPVEGVDYSLVYGAGNWQKASDGYYYFTSPVLAGASTDILIASLSEITEAPGGYVLSVQIAASAIQSTPVDTVQSLWGARVLDNGNISVN